MSAEPVYEAMRSSAMCNWVGPGDPETIGRTNFTSVIENITLQPNHSVFDFGCGIGRTSAALAEFLGEGGRRSEQTLFQARYNFAGISLESSFLMLSSIALRRAIDNTII